MGEKNPYQNSEKERSKIKTKWIFTFTKISIMKEKKPYEN